MTIDIAQYMNAMLRDLDSYAESRKNDVARGAETPELAGLIVQKYGYGLAKALRMLCDAADVAPLDITSSVDRRVAEIDPQWRENQRRRFAARPAAITFS